MSGSGSRVVNAPCNTYPATVQITHPAHPLRGQMVSVQRVLHQPAGIEFLIEWPDGQAGCIPLGWTDQTNNEPVTPGAKFKLKQLTILRRWLDSHLRPSRLDKQSEIVSPERKDNFSGGNDDETKLVFAPRSDCVGSTNTATTATTCGAAGDLGPAILEGAASQSAACHLKGEVS